MAAYDTLTPALAIAGIPVFNVLNYGAVADGTGLTGVGTDNTSSFNAAIAAASVKGGIVYVPPGIFRLATSILSVTTSGVHVRGAGRGCSNIFFDSTVNTNGNFGRLIFDGGATSGTISDVSCRDVTVFNASGVAVSTTPPAGYDGSNCCITFRGCNNFILDGTECYNAPNYGISILRSTNGVITNNVSHDQTADFFHVQDGCANITIAHNFGYNNYDDCIGVAYEGQPCTNIILYGNNFKNSGGGISIYAPVDGIVVEANVIDTIWLSGIKAAPASQLGGSYNYINNISIQNNIVKNAGTNIGYQRAAGIACGILISSTNGFVNGCKVTNNTLYNSLNGHIWAIPEGGTISDLHITGNRCSGIAGTGGKGNSTSGTGNSQPSPASGVYPAIWVQGVTDQVIIIGNTVEGSYNWGILCDSSLVANIGIIIVANNIITGLNSSGASNIYAVNLTSGIGASSGNIAQASTIAGAENITTNLYSAVGTILANYETVVAADNFTRANVTPASGALGNTSTGALTWVGSAAGIISNTAYFAAGYFPATTVNCGASNVDVSVTVTLNGSSARVIARSTAAPASGAGVILDTGGFLLYYDGTTSHYIGTFTAIATTGAHVLRLVVNGNTVTGYIDGAKVASGTYTAGLPTTTYVGFQDDSSTGSARFSNFSVSSLTA